MQIHLPLRSSIDTSKAHVRSLRVWVLELFAWWVARPGSCKDRIDLCRDIRDGRREVRDLPFLTMVSRMTFQRRAKRWMRPPSARDGFRHAHRRLTLVRLYTRGVRLKTLRNIPDVLNDFERTGQPAIARAPRVVFSGGLTIVVMTRCVAGFTAIAAAAEGANTS